MRVSLPECERLWPEQRTLVEPESGIEIIQFWTTRHAPNHRITAEWAQVVPGDIALPEGMVLRERFTRKPFSRHTPPGAELLLVPAWLDRKELMDYLRGR